MYMNKEEILLLNTSQTPHIGSLSHTGRNWILYSSVVKVLVISPCLSTEADPEMMTSRRSLQFCEDFDLSFRPVISYINVIWKVTPCSLVDPYQCFE
jgi:hypothetical protein